MSVESCHTAVQEQHTCDDPWTRLLHSEQISKLKFFIHINGLNSCTTVHSNLHKDTHYTLLRHIKARVDETYTILTIQTVHKLGNRLKFVININALKRFTIYKDGTQIVWLYTTVQTWQYKIIFKEEKNQLSKLNV